MLSKYKLSAKPIVMGLWSANLTLQKIGRNVVNFQEMEVMMSLLLEFAISQPRTRKAELTFLKVLGSSYFNERSPWAIASELLEGA